MFTFVSGGINPRERSNRQELNGTLTLINNSARYQFLYTNQVNADVVLPSNPYSGLRFLIRRINTGTGTISIPSSNIVLDGAILVQAELIYDGVEWQTLIF